MGVHKRFAIVIHRRSDGTAYMSPRYGPTLVWRVIRGWLILADIVDVRARLKYFSLCLSQQRFASTCLPVPGPASNGALQCRHMRMFVASESLFASCHHMPPISVSVVILSWIPRSGSATISAVPISWFNVPKELFIGYPVKFMLHQLCNLQGK
jgi:hypothetical protein